MFKSFVFSENNMIEIILKEYEAQPVLLKKKQNLEEAPYGSVFVGSGDSYVAAALAYYLSGGKFLYFDPYYVIARPKMCKNKTVYFISVSGMTKSNIIASRKLVNIAKKRTAVSSNPNSRLARVCDYFIRIPYESKWKLPGILSFSLTVSTLLELCGFGTIDFPKIFRKAQQASLATFSERGTTFALGEGYLYPVAQYLVLKVYEFFGKKAQSYPLEDFMHAPIFSLRWGDSINIFTFSDPEGIGDLLTRKLKNKIALFRFASNAIETVFYCIFSVQRSMIENMKKNNIVVPYFLSKRYKLELSNEAIY